MVNKIVNSTAATAAAVPIAAATIVTNVAAPTTKTTATSVTPTTTTNSKINAQTTTGIAPDGSGKSMIQFEALVGSGPHCYATMAEAQRAVLEEITYKQYQNCMEAPVTGGYRLLVW